MPKLSHLFLFCSSLIVLSACGGGGGGESSNSNSNNTEIPTSTINGTISSAANMQFDSDLNDINTPFIDNSTFTKAQNLQNFVTLQGFVTKTPTRDFSSTNNDRSFDRYFLRTDVTDIFQVQLQAGQNIQLQVVNFEPMEETGAAFAGDIDLTLYNQTYDIVDSSALSTEFERVKAPTDGIYYIEAFAWAGASKYILKIIAISNFAKINYTKKYSVNKKKIIVLPSGSSIKRIFKFSNKKKFFKIGYFGSLYKSRGINLIRNLAKIDNENQYYLYGDFNRLNNFKFKNSTTNLHLQDYIPYKDIPDSLAEMDILLMPYISSITVAGDVGDITKFTSPLKLFDYLSMGKIIICSDIQVLKEVIKDKENAIFVKNYKNIFAWKSKIHKLKNQPQKQFIMSKNNYQLSLKYSLKERAKKILEVVG